MDSKRKLVVVNVNHYYNAPSLTFELRTMYRRNALLVSELYILLSRTRLLIRTPHVVPSLVRT